MTDAQGQYNKKVVRKMDPRRIATVKQVEYLLDFLRDNKELICGRMRSKDGAAIVKNLWDKCTEQINRFGPPRSAKEWAKYWSDLKSRARSKIIEPKNEKSLDAEDQAVAKIPILSNIEKKIIKILQLLKPDQEVQMISSENSSPYSTNTTIVKEEREENGPEMNVEDFISTVPIIEVAVTNGADGPSNSVNSSGRHQLPVSQPPMLTQQPRPPNGARGLFSLTVPIPTNGNQPKKPENSAQPLPSEVTSSPKQPKPSATTATPKRRRRRALPRSGNQCTSCEDFKEFSQMLLKLEEGHARTAKLQTEAALKMTEVLKMQAEGLINTGAALRDMASNLSRLLEAQAAASSSTPTM